MFIKLTSSGAHRYVQLVESFRGEDGRPRQRTVATLGRADRLGEIDKLLTGLMRATGREPGRAPEPVEAPAVQFESALAMGHVWALSELWQQLGKTAGARDVRA